MAAFNFIIVSKEIYVHFVVLLVLFEQDISSHCLRACSSPQPTQRILVAVEVVLQFNNLSI